MAVRAGPNFINNSWFQINKYGPRDMLARSSLTEEGIESISSNTYSVVTVKTNTKQNTPLSTHIIYHLYTYNFDNCKMESKQHTEENHTIHHSNFQSHPNQDVSVTKTLVPYRRRKHTPSTLSNPTPSKLPFMQFSVSPFTRNIHKIHSSDPSKLHRSDIKNQPQNLNSHKHKCNKQTHTYLHNLARKSQSINIKISKHP